MAVSYNPFLFLLTVFSFLYLIPIICSLSTVSISETSNETLICALNQNSSLLCSTFPRGSIQIPVNISHRNLKFSGVVSGNGFVCALGSPLNSNSSVILCWRFSANVSDMSYKRIYRGPELEELKAGNSHICGLVRGSRRLLCWQWPRFDSSRTFQNFNSIAVGENFVCGLTADTRSIVCQGNGISSGPSGNYSVIAAGFRHACAITLDNDLACWGGEMGGAVPRGKFSALALGENRSCALRSSNGTVVCWGSNNFGLPDQLQKIQFSSIEAKQNVFCGIEASNFSLHCWGNEDFASNSSGSSETILPGPCQRDHECLCGPLLGSGMFCTRGFMICQYCKTENETPETPPVSPGPSPDQNFQTKTWNTRNVAFLVVGCIGTSSFVLVVAFFVFKYCKNRCRVHDSGRLDESRTLEAPKPLQKRLSKLASMGNPSQLQEFSLDELLQATSGFSTEYKVGNGSFGSVYHGILSDGRHVAIKRAEINHPLSQGIIRKQRQNDTDSAFVNELESLSRLNHKNLVKLLGFYEDDEERVLVYEYMDNGTLNDHLHNPQNNPPSWVERVKIALDAARGIQYLHEFVVPSVIHRDIKSSNILLDATGTAKVSDFGLSLMGPTDEVSHLSLRAAGTVGYIDPEYFRLQQLTIKSDVYSFGVVLLELLSGQKAIHKNEEGNRRNVVDYVVPYVLQDEIHRVLDRRVPPPTPYEIEAVANVGYLAADCVSLEARERPSMAEVVSSLERALTACLVQPQPLSRSTTESSAT